MFTIGTGVGGGLVLNGSLYRGATSAGRARPHGDRARPRRGRAGPRGHVPAAGLARDARRPAARSTGSPSARPQQHPDSFLGKRLAEDGEVTGHDVVDGAHEPATPTALRVLRILGERLGIGIANAINLFDPEEIVIGGGVSLAGDLLLEPARKRRRASHGARAAACTPRSGSRATAPRRASSARRWSPRRRRSRTRRRGPRPASTPTATSRSPSTGSSATSTRSRSSAPTARSTGTAARRFDSPSVFGSILDKDKGGFYALRPTGRRLDLQAALLPGHERPDHALLHRATASARSRTSCRSRRRDGACTAIG